MQIREHRTELDGLRGIAVLMVLIAHTQTAVRNKTTSVFEVYLSNFLHNGWLGVELFFVLSGFLITGILCNQKEDLGNRSSLFFKSFYARRVLRIFPLYYFVIFIVFVFFESKVNVKELLHYLTYTSNFYHVYNPLLTHFWSLAIEEQFYLVWPLIIFYANTENLRRNLPYIIGLIVILRLLLVLTTDINVYRNTFTRIDSLFIGALLALTLRSKRFKTSWYNEEKWIFIFVMFSSILLLILNDGRSQQSTFFKTIGYTLFSFVFMLVILVSLMPASRPHFLTKLLNSKTLRFFGKYSYAVYVFHVPIRYYLLKFDFFQSNSFSWGFNFVSFFVSMTIVSILLAIISWNLFERRFLAYKKHFYSSYSQSIQKN